MRENNKQLFTVVMEIWSTPAHGPPEVPSLPLAPAATFLPPPHLIRAAKMKHHRAVECLRIVEHVVHAFLPISLLLSARIS